MDGTCTIRSTLPQDCTYPSHHKMKCYSMTLISTSAKKGMISQTNILHFYSWNLSRLCPFFNFSSPLKKSLLGLKCQALIILAYFTYIMQLTSRLLTVFHLFGYSNSVNFKRQLYCKDILCCCCICLQYCAQRNVQLYIPLPLACISIC